MSQKRTASPTSRSAITTRIAAVLVSFILASTACFGPSDMVGDAMPAGFLASITVTPETMLMAPGQEVDFVLKGHDSHGAEVEVYPAWSIKSGPGIINDSGHFIAPTTGKAETTVIRGSAGGFFKYATVATIATSVGGN